jgi:penicillin-binding protein-related factor A (putative recombinase)
MEDQIPEKSKVDYVGEYNPTYFGFGAHQKNVRPLHLKL